MDVGSGDCSRRSMSGSLIRIMHSLATLAVGGTAAGFTRVRQITTTAAPAVSIDTMYDVRR
jgi:hypothetical protein